MMPFAWEKKPGKSPVFKYLFPRFSVKFFQETQQEYKMQLSLNQTTRIFLLCRMYLFLLSLITDNNRRNPFT